MDLDKSESEDLDQTYLAEDMDKQGSQRGENLNVLRNTLSVKDIEQEVLVLIEELAYKKITDFTNTPKVKLGKFLYKVYHTRKTC